MCLFAMILIMRKKKMIPNDEKKMDGMIDEE
jgi:hypothetical protein